MTQLTSIQSSTLTQHDPHYGESLSRMLNEAASLSEQMFELQEVTKLSVRCIFQFLMLLLASYPS